MEFDFRLHYACQSIHWWNRAETESGAYIMADKRCEMCGKPLIHVKADRRFCGACMRIRRKAYAKQYQELRKGMNKNDNGTDARDCKNNRCQNF